MPLPLTPRCAPDLQLIFHGAASIGATPPRSPKDIVFDFMRAIERGDAGEKLREHFDESFVQDEMPNRLNPKGQRSDLATVLRRSEQGKAMLRRQSYEVKSIIAEGTLRLCSRSSVITPGQNERHR